MAQIDLESGDDDIAEIQQEITVLSGCDSPCITKYYGISRKRARDVCLTGQGASSEDTSCGSVCPHSLSVCLQCSYGVSGWRVVSRSGTEQPRTL
jgi:hypothetical protein